MDEKIILADGTEIENARCMVSGGGLFIYLLAPKMDMRDAFNLFWDAGETATGRIIHEYLGEQVVYEGYTELHAINRENGNINLTMRRAE